MTFEELGLPSDTEYLLYDFWNKKLLGSFKDRFTSTRLEPRSNLLLAIHPKMDHPQFLSTDRHITQGAVSLEELHWDSQSKILSGTVKLVGGFPSRLVFTTPPGYQIKQVDTDNSVEINTILKDNTATVIMMSDQSKPATWKIKF